MVAASDNKQRLPLYKTDSYNMSSVWKRFTYYGITIQDTCVWCCDRPSRMRLNTRVIVKKM